MRRAISSKRLDRVEKVSVLHKRQDNLSGHRGFGGVRTNLFVFSLMLLFFLQGFNLPQFASPFSELKRDYFQNRQCGNGKMLAIASDLCCSKNSWVKNSKTVIKPKETIPSISRTR